MLEAKDQGHKRKCSPKKKKKKGLHKNFSGDLQKPKVFTKIFQAISTRRVARIWKRGGYLERVRKVQTTLTRIFIVLESVSHGLSKNWDEISRKARKFEGFFLPKAGGLQKKKVFTDFETVFSTAIGNSNVWGGLFSYGGGLFSIFHKKSASKQPNRCDFAYFTSQWGGLEPPPPPPSPLATLLISTKKRFPKNFSTAPQNFNNSKNIAVLEPRTGQFSRTWGLEAKAKDLTFEAKDFKMCLRGQGRPRGLHLWYLHCIWSSMQKLWLCICWPDQTRSKFPIKRAPKSH